MHRGRSIALAGCLLLAATALTAAEIPPRPEDLTYPALAFEVPDPGAMRFELANGIPVYADPDTQFPLATVTVYFRGGQYLEPAGKSGLATVTAQAWRTGGAGDLSAQDLDERLDFLAAQLSTSIGDVSGSVRLNVLSKDLETGMGLMMDVLERPRFQEDRFAKAKDDLLQEMKRRNDDSADIESREWSRLIYGDDFWMNRLPVASTVAAVGRDDSLAFVHRLIRSDQIVVAAAGDFDRAALEALLNRTLGTLPAATEPLPEIPQPTFATPAGVYVVDKTDVNQGRVSIGELGVRLGNPDEFPLRVANDILGGGGFTSRITKRVRSDEGLAYSAGSMMTFPNTIPGSFRAYFQSKSSTVPRAIGIVMQQIRTMGSEEVSADELSTAKSSFVETFPRRFESPEQTAGTFASDELVGRPHSYWTTYRDRIKEVTAPEVEAATRRHLDPEHMVILVVGNIGEIMKGHPEDETKLSDFGPIHRLPLRDPMTLEPLP
jgi:zinc protease